MFVIWGKIDVLVCNVVINLVYGLLLDLIDDVWDKIMDINVKSIFWLCNMVFFGMVEVGGGLVILLLSIVVIKGNDKIGCYGMLKVVEVVFLCNLVVEWGLKGICVNVIVLGVVVIDFVKVLVEDFKCKVIVENQMLFCWFGQFIDIVGVVQFLVMDVLVYMIGQYLVVDGGMIIC